MREEKHAGDVSPFRYPLGQIAKDLWGDGTYDLNSSSAAAAAIAKTDTQEADEKAAARSEAPERTDIEKLWAAADAPVDWTDALVSDHPTDGVTSARLWHFFRSHAAEVLDGSTDAYLEVLDAANPLGDLTPYVRSYEVAVENADSVAASFEGDPAFAGADEKTLRRYLSGMAVRICRDLMALLPVVSASVYAKYEGEPRLNVTFTRAQMKDARFGFMDPEAFVRACGGWFAGDGNASEDADHAADRS